MTAIAAAIVELKAHCEHTWEVIRALEQFAHVVEEAHGKAAGAVQKTSATVSFPAPARRQARPAKATRAARKAPTQAAPAKPNGTPAPTGHVTKAAGNTGLAIIRALGTAREPLSPKALVRLTKLPRWRVMKTLLDMHAAGQLAKVGKHRGAKYALPSKPRPGAVAGTQAAPPVGPPSANGRQASPEGFETVWSGTAERNGQAPAILSAAGRERRS